MSLLSKIQGIVWSVVWTTRHISDREQMVFVYFIFIKKQCVLIYASPVTFETLIFFSFLIVGFCGMRKGQLFDLADEAMRRAVPHHDFNIPEVNVTPSSFRFLRYNVETMKVSSVECSLFKFHTHDLLLCYTVSLIITKIILLFSHLYSRQGKLDCQIGSKHCDAET